MWGTIHSTPVQATKLVRFPRAVIVLTAALVLHPPLQVFRSRAPAFLNSQDIIAYSLNCPADDTSANCLQRAFVMRMTFAHALFHLVCNRPCHPSLVHDFRFLVFGVWCLVFGVFRHSKQYATRNPNSRPSTRSLRPKPLYSDTPGHQGGQL